MRDIYHGQLKTHSWDSKMKRQLYEWKQESYYKGLNTADVQGETSSGRLSVKEQNDLCGADG